MPNPTSPNPIEPGALVNCSDYPLGAVERVETDPSSGAPRELVVRHARADYLLRVPARLIASASDGVVTLSARLDEVETAAVAPEAADARASGVAEGSDTDKGPPADQVLGQPPGVLKTDPQT